MNMTELRLKITDLNPSVGFTLVPTLPDGSGWILGAFTDMEHVVEVKYYNIAIPPDSGFHYLVESQSARQSWFMASTIDEVAAKVVELLALPTPSTLE